MDGQIIASKKSNQFCEYLFIHSNFACPEHSWDAKHPESNTAKYKKTEFERRKVSNNKIPTLKLF